LSGFSEFRSWGCKFSQKSYRTDMTCTKVGRSARVLGASTSRTLSCTLPNLWLPSPKGRIAVTKVLRACVLQARCRRLLAFHKIRLLDSMSSPRDHASGASYSTCGSGHCFQPKPMGTPDNARITLSLISQPRV